MTPEEEDRLDSNMLPGERGNPYTMAEVEGAIRATPKGALPYHVDIMNFLVRRVKRLEAERTAALDMELKDWTRIGEELSKLPPTFKDLPSDEDEDL